MDTVTGEGCCVVIPTPSANGRVTPGRGVGLRQGRIRHDAQSFGSERRGDAWASHLAVFHFKTSHAVGFAAENAFESVNGLE